MQGVVFHAGLGVGWDGFERAAGLNVAWVPLPHKLVGVTVMVPVVPAEPEVTVIDNVP